MIILTDKEELSNLYDKAEKGYYACIRNKENDYLQDEISIPIEQIVIQRDTVKVIFRRDNAENYLLEVRINLKDTSENLLGYYAYIENDKGNYEDEFLVFK